MCRKPRIEGCETLCTVLSNNEGACGIEAAAELLAGGALALDALEAGVRLVEADPSVWTVGRGGWPNLLGIVELDASVMDGDTLRSGAVGAVTGFLHPVSIARRLLEELPHEFLVGEGAMRFAREIGAEQGELLADHARVAWSAWFQESLRDDERAAWPGTDLRKLCWQSMDPEIGKDTTVFLGLDGRGSLATATSTSGWGWKYPGRLGDSPVIGAGSYADSRFGACACTGVGEMTIRCGTARAVVLYMKMDMTVGEAVDAAVDDMRALKGGLIGRVTIHAIDRTGEHAVVAVNGEPGNHYWLWREGFARPERREARIATLHADTGSAATTHARAERHARAAAAALRALGGADTSAGPQFSGDTE